MQRFLPITCLIAGYFLTAWGGLYLTQAASGIASIWVPNGLMLGVLITGAVRTRDAFIGCGLANAAANLITGASFGLTLGFVAINLAEMATAMVLLRQFTALPIKKLTVQRFLQFGACVAVSALLASFAGSWFFQMMVGSASTAILQSWVVAGFAGSLLIGTIVIAWLLPRDTHADAARPVWHWPILVFAMLVCGYLVFVADWVIALDAFIPVLFWAAFAFGLRCLVSSLGALFIMTIGLLLTGLWAPPGANAMLFSDQILLVQTFILLSTIGLVPLALLTASNRAAAARLQASEAQYRTFYNRTPVMMHSIDKSGALISVSDYWTEVMGYAREEALGKKSVDFLTPESRSRALQAIPDFLRRGTYTNIPYQMVKRDGSIIDVLLSAIVVNDDEGNFSRAQAVIVDVTERNRAQAQLRDAVEVLDSGFLLLNPKMQIVTYNQRLLEILDQLRDLIYPGQAFTTILRATFERGQFETEFSNAEELVADRLLAHQKPTTSKLYTRHDGAIIDVRRMATTEGGMVSLLTDITEIRKTDVELANRNQELERANHDLQSFVSIASHDLKAPLRAVSFLSECVVQDLPDVLSGTSDPNELTANAALITQRIDRMGRMLDDLLTFAQIGSDVEALSIIDTSTLLSDIAVMHQPCKLTITIEPNIPAVQIRRSQFETIGRNLISNAIKHHDRDAGELTITGRLATAHRMGDPQQPAPPQPMVELRFTDDGPGIPEQHRERVFNLFQTLQSRDKVEGTGLGLSVVKRILELAGGTIAVEASACGNRSGCVFVICLPAAPPDQAIPSADL